MSKPAVDRRATDIKAIHVMRRQLGMTAEDAALLQVQVTGCTSSADMTHEQRAKLIKHLRRLVDLQLPKPAAGKRQPPLPMPRPAAQRAADDEGDERWTKARALWQLLHAAGKVRNASDEALTAYVRRQTHVEAWRFLNGHQINTVIESLKRWCDRAGVEMAHA